MKLNKILLPALVLCMSAILLPTTAYAGGGDYEEQPPSASATVDPEAPPELTPEPKPFTPDGQATVVDNVTDEDGKEFYTFVTPNENVFYLVIDKQREQDNVYFLNAVTEDDLMNLAEKSEDSTSAVPEIPVCTCTAKCVSGEVDTACSVCVNTKSQCIGKSTEPTPPTEEIPEKPKKESSGGTLIFILLAVAIAGGAGYYFKVYKPKKDLDDAEDFDEIVTGEDEPTINEDTQIIHIDEDEQSFPTISESVDEDYPDDDYPDDEPKE